MLIMLVKWMLSATSLLENGEESERNFIELSLFFLLECYKFKKD